MTIEAPLSALLARWITVLSMAALIGGLGLDVLILPRDAHLLAARTRLRRWSRVWALALTVASLVELFLRASTMSGGDAEAALGAIPIVLARTHFGVVWMARLTALAVVLLAGRAGGTRPAIGLVAAIGVGLTSSLTGHAADWGDLSLSVLADWIHIVASALWTGGLVGLVLVATGALRAWPASLVSAVARRFSRMAGACLLCVVATGVYGAWVEVPALATLWTTPYGRWLVAKLAIVLGIVGLGAVNRYRIVPRLTGDAMRIRLFTLIRREAALAMLVFACTAGLTESTPARHAHHVHTDTTGARTTHDHVMSP